MQNQKSNPQQTSWRDNQWNVFIVRTLLSQFSLVISASSTHPLDTVKIRLQKEGEMILNAQSQQKKYKNLINGLVIIGKEEGVKGIYKGLNMAITRELSYGTLRTSLYEPYKDLLLKTEFFQKNQGATKLFAGLLSGTTGAILANPADVLKIRLQAHTTERVTISQEISTIMQQDRILGFWKGVIPNVLRGSIVTATQLGTYDITKTFIKVQFQMEDNFNLYCCSAFAAGLALTITACPFDLVKTRLMSANINKSYQYKGVMDCVIKTYQNEGLTAFYKGFGSQWARFGTLSCIYFMTWETLRKKAGIKTI